MTTEIPGAGDVSTNVERPAYPYLDEARRYVEGLPRIPGVVGPFIASSLTWQGAQLFYVVGRDSESRLRLVEVFRVTSAAELEPIPAFQYPQPIRDLFPVDMACIYHPDPWKGMLPRLTTSQMVAGLQEMFKEDERSER